MEPHPVPRQITTFEFKLIGFLTVKQFLYIALFSGIGILIYLITPIPYLNIISGVIFVVIGVILAFVKFNERPIDVFIKNLIIRLTTPSQYFYKKNNDLPDFFDIQTTSDPQIVNTHVDAKQKVHNYLYPNDAPIHPTTQPITPITPQVKTPIESVGPNLNKPIAPTLSKDEILDHVVDPETTKEEAVAPLTKSTQLYTPPTDGASISLSGIVHTAKNVKLPNIMIYVKDTSGSAVRILKTDSHGVFNSPRPLNVGSYTLEAVDLGKKYFFDTMNIQVQPESPPLQLELQSKEII